jgi:hypothetical protein
LREFLHLLVSVNIAFQGWVHSLTDRETELIGIGAQQRQFGSHIFTVEL